MADEKTTPETMTDAEHAAWEAERVAEAMKLTPKAAPERQAIMAQIGEVKTARGAAAAKRMQENEPPKPSKHPRDMSPEEFKAFEREQEAWHRKRGH